MTQQLQHCSYFTIQLLLGTILGMYTLSDLGDLSNLNGSLSRTI